ncbi:PREDICTED: PILR alpha-associated neural protein [Nanorana parkeri]|uniref:PILR alpha-associated neural protein n=1 Tax=Nanorana parkeri TaxID=125878 RepID=UPI0008542522|nr:PREDICTED: PILR alpha-associated neural protein [Nanorana parkeri]XP_018408735.1 PREDICTED: PILR alpha-associated neural protein [Nanorana parkeri]XP_018408736.1 PREDICTED: PILR alpha-associated neural protein [Nanorana parkeri]
MKWSGCGSIYCIFYSLLLSSTCSSFPRPLHPTKSHHHGAIRPTSSPHLAAHQHLYTSLHSTKQPSGNSHISSPQLVFPIVQSQNVPPKIQYFPHRNTQHPHQQSVPTRGKRQSEASSLLFPAALEGAVLPSQYPWAILWGPTVSDEEGAQSSASSTPRPYYHHEWGLLEHGEPARGLDLKGVPTTLRPHGFPPLQEGTDPQLYVTIVISVLIVLVATGIIIKFCCERRQKRRRNRNERCALPEEGSLQPLTDLSPDSDIPGLHPLKLGDFNKSGLDDRSVPCRTSKIPVVTM